jgi:hypothetical protein
MKRISSQLEEVINKQSREDLGYKDMPETRARTQKQNQSNKKMTEMINIVMAVGN